jgi:hypothetical protein
MGGFAFELGEMAALIDYRTSHAHLNTFMHSVRSLVMIEMDDLTFFNQHIAQELHNVRIDSFIYFIGSNVAVEFNSS